jgi:hypothetical protein
MQPSSASCTLPIRHSAPLEGMPLPGLPEVSRTMVVTTTLPAAVAVRFGSDVAGGQHRSFALRFFEPGVHKGKERA